MAETPQHFLLDQLAELEKLREGAPEVEMRQLPRNPVRGDAELIEVDQRFPQDRAIPVQLRDVSRFGLGFVCQTSFDIDARWRALFLYDNQHMAQEVFSIRHCRDLGNGIYLAGAQVCLDGGLLRLLGADPTGL